MVAPALEYSTVPVEGVNVPPAVILKGVPLPESVRVLDERSKVSGVALSEAIPIVKTAPTVVLPFKV